MIFKDFYESQVNKLRSQNNSSPILDVDLIFCEVLGISRHEIIVWPVERVLKSKDVDEIIKLVNERCLGKSLASLFGYKYFYKNKFIVDQHVLVPRPETELLVEKAIALIQNKEKPNILDLGTGTGCIGLSIAKELEDSCLTAVDISPKALMVFEKNLKQLDIKNKVAIECFNIRDIALNYFSKKFDLIVANPPYIDEVSGYVQETVKKYEPHIALFSNQNGFEDISVWSEKAYQWLKEGGYYVMEFGDHQEKQVRGLFDKSNFFLEYSIHKDYSGLPRFVSAKK